MYIPLFSVLTLMTVTALAIGSETIAAYAATCTEGPTVLSGSSCQTVGGQCTN
jgi:hypothetical protein